MNTLTGSVNPLCPPVLDECADGTVAVYNPNGDNNAALRWLGMKPAKAIVDKFAIIPYIAPSGFAAGTPTSAVPEQICCYGAPVEIGEPCYIGVEDFGTIKRTGDRILEGTNELPYCERSPLVTVDGIRIDNDMEWHEAKVSSQMMNDLMLNMAIGDNQGLNHWGIIPLLDGTAEAAGYYGCDWLTPHVLDWGGAAPASASDQVGITYDGVALTGKLTRNIYVALKSVFKAHRGLFNKMPSFNTSGLNFGDVAILGAEDAFECLTDAQACEVRCDSESVRVDNEVAKAYAEELLAGGVGYGELRFSNFTVPMLPFNPYNWDTNLGVMDNGDGTYNMMMLWRGAGANRAFELEYNPLQSTRRKTTRDNGLFQLGYDNSEDCDFLSMMAQWRWNLRNPCLQLYITNVPCESIDQCAPDYQNITALDDCAPGECPEDVPPVV